MFRSWTLGVMRLATVRAVPAVPAALAALAALAVFGLSVGAAALDLAGHRSPPGRAPRGVARAAVDQPQPPATPSPAPTEPPPMTPTAAPPPALVVLYDGARGTGLPETQGLLLLSRAAAGTTLAATQAFTDGVTTLRTSTQTSDMAGYFPKPGLVGGLDRAAGFTVRFSVHVAEEEHGASDKNGDGVGDRAGFSVIALASDRRGIELGFWRDQVWAQADGPAEPPPNSNTLFTHAEGARFDAGAELVTYDLRIQGDAYTLGHAGGTILSGPLRDYGVFGWPYNVPDFVFLGDDTSTASATIRLAFAAVAKGPPGEAGPAAVFLPWARREAGDGG